MSTSDSTLRLFCLINTVLFVGYWAFMIGVYPALPAEIPVHFGAFGEATRYSTTSIFSWFLVPGIVSVIVAPLLFLTSALPHLSLDTQWYNYPFKNRILQLNSDQRKPFKFLVNRYSSLLLNTAIFWTLLMFFTIAIYRYAYVIRDGSLMIISIPIIISILMAFNITWLYVRLRKRIKSRLFNLPFQDQRLES